MTHCQTFIQELRQRGFRITPQREMIIETLAHDTSHLTAEEIYARVRERTKAINLATVYRTLEWLVEQGLVSRSDLGTGQEMYCTIMHGPHIHLVCRRCGAVIDADYRLAVPLAERLQSGYGFAPDLQHLTMPGLCAACRGDFEE